MRLSSNQLVNSVAAIRQRVVQLVGDLSPEQLEHRPEPTQWSIAECLAHLNLTAAVVQPPIAAAIEKGRREKISGTGEFEPGPMGRLLLWMAEPPPKFRMRAPKNVAVRVAHADPSQLLAEFMRFQDAWEKLIRDCEGLNLTRLKVAMPFSGLPRLRLAAPIPWMIAHERRHLWQAENVKCQILSRPAA
jgi:DinB family protein